MSRFVLAALVFLSCSEPPPAPAIVALKADATGVTIEPDAPQWRYVTLAVATAGKPLDPLPAPGRVSFDEARSASLGSPLGGRVETVRVRLGDAVKSGDRLFSVRSGDFADLGRDEQIAREQVALKTRVLERQRELFRLQATPEKDVVAADAELKEAEFAFKAATARRASLAIEASGENIFWVKAPRGGLEPSSTPPAPSSSVDFSRSIRVRRSTPLRRWQRGSGRRASAPSASPARARRSPTCAAP